MKVLRKPEFSEWIWKFTCYECTAVLEACPTDVEAVYHPAVSSPKPGDSTEAFWTFHVTCPICTTKRQVPTNDVPRGLQFELKDRHSKQMGAYQSQGGR